MGFDDDFMKEQNKLISKGTFDPHAMVVGKETIKDEGKSLKEMMQMKRLATEKEIEGKKPPVQQPGQESIEERKARLKARALMLKQKKDQHAEELQTFNAKTTTQSNLHRELLEMDKKIKPGTNKGGVLDGVNPSPPKAGLGFQQQESPEEKRQNNFQHIKKQVHKDLEETKEEDVNAKMDLLNKRQAEMDKMRDAKDLQAKEEIAAKAGQEEQRKEANKGFLAGIQSFSIDDM